VAKHKAESNLVFFIKKEVSRREVIKKQAGNLWALSVKQSAGQSHSSSEIISQTIYWQYKTNNRF
jgi:hypothetical protein